MVSTQSTHVPPSTPALVPGAGAVVPMVVPQGVSCTLAPAVDGGVAVMSARPPAWKASAVAALASAAAACMFVMVLPSQIAAGKLALAAVMGSVGLLQAVMTVYGLQRLRRGHTLHLELRPSSWTVVVSGRATTFAKAAALGVHTRSKTWSMGHDLLLERADGSVFKLGSTVTRMDAAWMVEMLHAYANGTATPLEPDLLAAPSLE